MKDAKKGRQGFASMPHDRRVAIARLGGKTAHQKGTAHEWTSAEAYQAGIKGAAVRRAKLIRRESDDADLAMG